MGPEVEPEKVIAAFAKITQMLLNPLDQLVMANFTFGLALFQIITSVVEFNKQLDREKMHNSGSNVGTIRTLSRAAQVAARPSKA